MHVNWISIPDLLSVITQTFMKRNKIQTYCLQTSSAVLSNDFQKMMIHIFLLNIAMKREEERIVRRV
jgi:hypothetical protein